MAQKQLLQGLLNTNTASSATPAAASSASAFASASAPVTNLTSEVEVVVPSVDTTAVTATTGKVRTLLITELISDPA